MAYRAAKLRHGTEPSGTPVKSLEEKETSPFLAEQAKLSAIFETASAALQTLVKEFIDDADKTFEDEDFKRLFSAEVLGPIRMTTDRWAIFMETFTTSTPWGDPQFPILDFLTEVLSTGSLSSKITKFLTELRARLKSTGPATRTHSYNTGREVDYDAIRDRKAKVNISISLPQYDGAKGKAAKFVAKFTHLAINQNFSEQEWDALLMDCLKKEALKHFENSRVKFRTHKLYFQALISFFDHRSSNDEKKWYRDTFKQRNGEAARTFYLRFLETITHLQTMDLFPEDDAIGFNRQFMDDFFCKLNDECYSIVDNKIRDKKGDPEDFTPEDFFEWIDNAQAFSSSITSLVKNQKTSNTQSQHQRKSSRQQNNRKDDGISDQSNRSARNNASTPAVKKEKHCYFCDKPGHTHKTLVAPKTWICPDKLAGKPASEAWNKYHADKGHILATITDPTRTRGIALTSDITYKGKHTWFNNEKTILDLGGCENLVNSAFANTNLQLSIYTDTSRAAQHIQQSVNGDKFRFQAYIEVPCNFKGHREVVRFYLMDNLPLPFLLGYPFFLEKKAVFDLSNPTVVLANTALKPVISLISTSSPQFSASVFTGNNDFMAVNSIFCNFDQQEKDLSAQEADEQLQSLLLEFESVFDLTDKTPAKVPEVDLKLKPEFQNKTFYCPEPMRSIADQTIIDRNAEELIAADRAFLNPFSKHNIGQVIVHRFDKSGVPILGRERVCLNLIPVNKCLEHFEFPIPRVEAILQKLMQYTVFSELDLAEGFNQLRVSKFLQQIFTFTSSKGKVSLKVLPFGVFWASSIFQASMCELFIELLTRCLQIYIDNLGVHSLSKREHLLHLRETLSICRDSNLHVRRDKCTFMVTTIKTLGFVISHNLLQPDPFKIDMLLQASTPHDRTSLRAFLSLLQYFRKMLVHLSHVCHSLYQLTSPNVKFEWTEAHNQAFLSAKDMIAKKILNTRFDPTKKTCVYFDASKFAVCGILLQNKEVICCASKTLNNAQRKMPTIERELFGFVFSCKKFRIFLNGHPFEAFTDHKPLVGLSKKIDNIDNQRMTAMLISTVEYSYTMSYLPGKKNILADYGTRHIPISDWDPPSEDPLELNPFLDCSVTLAVVQFPEISKHYYSSTDFDEMNKFGLQPIENNSSYSVILNGEQRIYVPVDLRRACFWAAHFPLHHGQVYTAKILREHTLYWPLMDASLAEFLSQCVCAKKKANKSKKFVSTNRHISASYPLQLVCIDLYFYDGVAYFTLIDVYSNFPFCVRVSSKGAVHVRVGYDKFCAAYATPENILSDNGGEFELIPHRDTTPSERPQANGKIERFHQELGKMSRVHSIPPDEAVIFLQSDLKKALFLNGIKLNCISDSLNLATTPISKQFRVYDLVYREVQIRKRAKQQDTFSGPHMILKVISDSTVIINSDKNYKGEMKVHIDQLKPFFIPDTTKWMLNLTYLKPALETLGLQLFQGINVFINFQALDTLTLQLLNSSIQKIFVIPAWYCATWYQPIHGVLKSKLSLVRLPSERDLFLDSFGNDIGIFSWDHFLCATHILQSDGTDI